MAKKSTSQFASHRIDARALLGLYDPSDATDWGPIRAAQINAGGRLALLTLVMHMIAASLTVVLGLDLVPHWGLIGWWALVSAVALGTALRRLSSPFRNATSAPVAAVRDTLLEGVALGAMWSVAPLVLAGHISAAHALGLCLILIALMATCVFAMAGVPLATLCFIAIVGAATSAMLWASVGLVFAGMMAFCTLMLIASCFALARALVVVRANQIALAERDETVSLLLRDTEDHAADWLWETDATRRIVRASPRFAYAVGLDPLTINQQPILQILAGPDWESGKFSEGLHTLAEKLKQREIFRDLLLAVHVKGERRWWEISAAPRFDDTGTFVGFRGVGSDVTEARASAEKINRMARFDALTGLPNRLLIHETLAAAMEAAEKWSQRCAFMMVDLDRFKAVNDSLGHPTGDRLLGQVARRLAALMSENDMVGRIGGDEFAVVIADANNLGRLEALAKTIIEAVSAPYLIDQNTLHIGASIGIALGPRDGRTAEMLIRSADLALYQSKDAGGGSYHIYEPQLHAQAEERRVLEVALRKALINGELSLAYEPVVDATDGALTGFEALLRWQHPTLGTIAPDKFIPLAEETRLIDPIGEWALRTACAEALRWAVPVRVAVNVSAEQLHNPGFLNVVASALANSGLPPERLEIEVTESVFLRDGTRATEMLERILDMGVRLSLDDFGTGYSSLGYLSHTRFSTIKIDRSFVQGAAAGKNEAIAIIRAVVALAQSLGMATTAEGVETEHEHRLIAELGCTKVQGYYFGRPLPADEARDVALRATSRSAAA